MRYLGVAIACSILLLGCGGAAGPGEETTSADGKKTSLRRLDQGGRCEVRGGREVVVDLNQDDVPDVRKIYKTFDETEVMVCREVDLNYDGVKDIFYFYDETGLIIRDEVDLDFDKHIDVVTTYAKGQAVKKEIDTNSDGMVDRVLHLKNNQPYRKEGDANGDGQVDLWEYYEGGKLVRIGTDDDGDGRADSWSRDLEPEEASAATSENTDADATADGAEGANGEKAEDKAAKTDTTNTTDREKKKDTAVKDTSADKKANKE